MLGGCGGGEIGSGREVRETHILQIHTPKKKKKKNKKKKKTYKR